MAVEAAPVIPGGQDAARNPATTPVPGEANRITGIVPMPPVSRRIPIVVDAIFGLFLMVEQVPNGLDIEWSYNHDPAMLAQSVQLRKDYDEGRLSIMEMRKRMLAHSKASGYFSGYSLADQQLLEWSYRMRLGEQAPAPNVEPLFMANDSRFIVIPTPVPGESK
jgi:hypothetical protein